MSPQSRKNTNEASAPISRLIWRSSSAAHLTSTAPISGDGVELWFVVESKTELTESEWRDCFEGYVDYNVIQYHPDESKTTEAFKITGTLHSRGGDNETESQGNFIVLHYDGKWVLHPVNFFNTFN